MWLWILAVFFLLLIWVGGYFAPLIGLPVSLWLQIGLTVLVVLMVVGVFLYRRWRAVAAARALEREIMKQAEKQAAAARPDRRAEIIELQQQMQRGIAALKRSKLGTAKGRSVLYSLPWYAIIGPPGAGKTTALRHSGLAFPDIDTEGGASIKGVGGTRNCDWWFTNDAILLDTAGRWTVQQEDHEEWLAFLGSLKKHRKKRPINGVIAAIPVPELIESTSEQIEHYARTLRARIDEVITRLQMVVPVYVMFTKTDLVAGFSEFFGDLRKSERAQVLGATFPLEGMGNTEPAHQFEGEFDQVVSNLHARGLRHLATERNRLTRQKIVQFPLEFQAVRNNVSEFIATLFQKNTYQETPLFRGFYFTSGTQEGRPIDRVLGGVARAFGLTVPQTVQQATESKSYFVTDLFRRVVFPDQNIAARTAAEARRQLLTRLAIAAVVLLIAPLFLLAASCSFSRNRDLTAKTVEASTSASEVNWSDRKAVSSKIRRLETMRAQLRQLDAWEKEGPPFGMTWGMYVGDDLYEPLRRAYVTHLDESLAKPTKAYLEKQLGQTSASEVKPGELYSRLYNELKIYLMLCTLQRLDVPWASKHLPYLWQKSIDVPAGVPLEPHSTYYLELMKRGDIQPWEANWELVRHARSVLLRVPRFERSYDDLVRDANADIEPVRREAIFYWTVSAYVSSRSEVQVDGAYTKLGWEMVREKLRAKKDFLAGERWVLGQEPNEPQSDVNKEIARLRNLYFQRYKNAWRDFIMDLDVHKPTNAEESLRELQSLSEPEWPYLRLIRAVNENVTLEVTAEEADQDESYNFGAKIDVRRIRLSKAGAKEAAKKLLGDAVDGGAEKPPRPVSMVERAFRPISEFGVAPPGGDPKNPPPTSLSQYQSIIAKLVGVLTDLRDADTPPDPNALSNEFQEAFRATSALLADQDGFTRPMLSPLLMNPISGAWASVVNDAGGAATGLWEVSVWQKYRETIWDRYPFAKSPKEVALKDFTTFFHPKEGLLWAFYDQNLKGSLKRNGERFTPSRRFGSTMNYTPLFLSNCLKRGAEITKVTFPPKGEGPLVEFQVNLHSVSENVAEVSIEIDGNSHVYKNHPEEWLKAQWPAPEGESRGARVRVRGYSGLDEEFARSGDFGFFRLLDAAKVTKGTAGGKRHGVPTLVATWKLRSLDALIKIDIKPTETEHPLEHGFFLDYKCPRVIVRQAR